MWLRRSEREAEAEGGDGEGAGDERRFRLRFLRNTLLDLRQVVISGKRGQGICIEHPTLQ